MKRAYSEESSRGDGDLFDIYQVEYHDMTNAPVNQAFQERLRACQNRSTCISGTERVFENIHEEWMNKYERRLKVTDVERKS